MALPSLSSKTWQFNVNNSFSALTSPLGRAGLDNSQAIFQIVTALIGFGSSPWTVDYSCLTAGNVGTKGDGINRWSSSGALVWAR